MDRRTAAFDGVSARTEFEPSKGYVSKILIRLVDFVAGLPGHVSHHVRGARASIRRVLEEMQFAA